jgi:hypothetical protein
MPYGIVGGRGDFVANVFVLGQRFDFATFSPEDSMQTRGTVDEQVRPTSLETFGNSRMTTSMFGSGYLEMVACEITEDLQAIAPGTRRETSSPCASLRTTPSINIPECSPLRDLGAIQTPTAMAS